ncbi:helix-turn-helix domain-containing protein [Micromonospora narathiwatensis]|uniref:Helix-turn-helix domain-containing protein n=1 Tax=Micromonospora narathiwatensis TaxID=299146 RepID=A0A1A8ZK72_9ACTN|nr:helix-turn-helix domain-containing protein [Micromonospora narathiwatensis]SBT44255.1 Helix-turn-helix domain-containing protein [Micromonospora narathiwatensis]
MTSSADRWAGLALHPVRIRILRSVAGARRTTRDLAAALPDVPQATIYRHVAALVAGGLLDVVEERKVRGTVERVYTLPAHGAALGPADLADANAEDHGRWFTAFVSSLLAEFSRYLSRDRIDLVADGVGYQQVVLHLSDEEFAEFAAELAGVIAPRLANRPGPGRVARLLATVLMPAEPASDTSSAAPQPAAEPATGSPDDADPH